jgi:septum formation protein
MTGSAVILILASGSPRRRQLLACLSLPFRVVVPDVDEDVPSAANATPEEMTQTLARAKALGVAQREGSSPVLAADTLVVDGTAILGKPRDAAEATAMLRRLRDREHRVITGLALVGAGSSKASVDHVTTAVRMRPYSEEEIAAYIARGEPFDKAGAYAIQDTTFHPVESYDGCYCNVVGLPLRAVVRLLRWAGFDITDNNLARLPTECGVCPVEV